MQLLALGQGGPPSQSIMLGDTTSQAVYVLRNVCLEPPKIHFPTLLPYKFMFIKVYACCLGCWLLSRLALQLLWAYTCSSS